jgi:predicted metal-dependent hydrolase
VTPSEGLVVVIPKGFDRALIPVLLEENAAWIARSLRRVASRPSVTARPEEVRLAAIDRTWRLDWLQTAEPNVTVSADGPFRLRLSGSVGEEEAWRPALRAWLISQGREHLIPWTEEMADTLGVRLSRITIRCQKTRWGSYTQRAGDAGSVSLNAQLLFLTHRLARYVILHELCHAIHANHSPAFWNLVRRHEAASDELRAELRSARRQVPLWIS